WQTQILGGLVSEIERFAGGRENPGKEYRLICREIGAMPAGPMNENVGVAQRPRPGIQPEIRNHPHPEFEPTRNGKIKIPNNASVIEGSSGHHDGASVNQLIALLMLVGPSEERRLVKLRGQMDIHGRLITSFYQRPAHEKRPGISPGPSHFLRLRR